VIEMLGRRQIGHLLGKDAVVGNLTEPPGAGLAALAADLTERATRLREEPEVAPSGLAAVVRPLGG